MSPSQQDLTALRAALRRELPDLRERYHVESLSLFGSRVRGGARPDSDLDVLVEYRRTPTLFQIGALEEHLSRLLGVNVDLVMKDSLKPRVGARILEEAVAV